MRNALLMPARPHSRDTQPNRACVGTEIACEKGVGCSLHAKKRRVRVRVRVTRVGRVPVAFAFFCFSPVFSVSALPRSGLRSPTTHMQDRTKYRILYMYQQQKNKTRDLIVRHRHGFSTPPSGESAEDHAPNFTDSPVLHSIKRFAQISAQPSTCTVWLVLFFGQLLCALRCLVGLSLASAGRVGRAVCNAYYQ